MTSAPEAAGTSKSRGWLLAICGVLLPVATLVFELTTHMCADMLVDPLATPLHVGLVAAVPLALAWSGLQLRAGQVSWQLAAALGLALGVAGYYALLFLPVTPLALVAVLWFGLGLLPLAPLAAFVSGIVLLRRVRRAGARWRPLALGAAAAWLLLIGVEVPGAVQRWWVAWALSDSPAQRTRGLVLLRSFGDREALLRACNGGRRSLAPGMLTFVTAQLLPHIGQRDARELYFRVTGQLFDAVSHPSKDWDPGIGGTSVANRVTGLELASSQLDGSIAADAGLGYLEWTLSFHNRSKGQQEARALIALPTGGVVSRATLWVGDEPREATFAAKGSARRAYDSVVARRRDPLLVTQPAPERMLVQCFPVPAGGHMRIRVGMTFPLLPQSDSRARFSLPYLVEQNFEVPASLQHAAWIEASAPLQSSARAASPLPSGQGLRASLATAALQQSMWTTEFVPAQHYSAAPQLDAALDSHVVQRYERAAPEQPGAWVVALDTSQALAGQRQAIAEQLARLAARAKLSIVLARDAEPHTLQFDAGSGAQLRAASAALDFVGGRDSLASATRAVELAAMSGLSEVLWITGAQPAELSRPDALVQWLARSAQPVRLVPFSFGSGEHPALHQLPQRAIAWPPRQGTPLGALEAFVALHTGDPAPWRALRERSAEPLGVAQKTGAHLTRLWAAQEVARGCPGRTSEQCVALAVQQQLVTELTGAVVLETQQQYSAAGLQPATGTNVPSVPEPATWLLGLGVLLTLLSVLVRRRSARPC